MARGSSRHLLDDEYIYEKQLESSVCGSLGSIFGSSGWCLPRYSDKMVHRDVDLRDEQGAYNAYIPDCFIWNDCTDGNGRLYSSGL